MSAEVVQCPACGAETRIPEELFGRAVRCPLCGTTFIAPTFRDGIATTDATIVPARPADGTMGRPGAISGATPGRDKNTNQSVGLAMLLVGMISLLVSGFTLNSLIADPEGMREQHDSAMKGLFKSLNRPEPTPEELAQSWQPDFMLKLYILSVCVSVTILAGSLCIMTRKFYGFACFSAVVAIFNFSNCCCMLGLPVGLWTLVVLLNPDVKALYRRDPARGFDDRSPPANAADV